MSLDRVAMLAAGPLCHALQDATTGDDQSGAVLLSAWMLWQSQNGTILPAHHDIRKLGLPETT